MDGKRMATYREVLGESRRERGKQGGEAGKSRRGAGARDGEGGDGGIGS